MRARSDFKQSLQARSDLRHIYICMFHQLVMSPLSVYILSHIQYMYTVSYTVCLLYPCHIYSMCTLQGDITN